MYGISRWAIHWLYKQIVNVLSSWGIDGTKSFWIAAKALDTIDAAARLKSEYFDIFMWKEETKSNNLEQAFYI